MEVVTLLSAVDRVLALVEGAVVPVVELGGDLRRRRTLALLLLLLLRLCRRAKHGVNIRRTPLGTTITFYRVVDWYLM